MYSLRKKKKNRTLPLPFYLQVFSACNDVSAACKSMQHIFSTTPAVILKGEKSNQFSQASTLPSPSTHPAYFVVPDESGSMSANFESQKRKSESATETEALTAPQKLAVSTK